MQCANPLLVLYSPKKLGRGALLLELSLRLLLHGGCGAIWAAIVGCIKCIGAVGGAGEAA